MEKIVDTFSFVESWQNWGTLQNSHPFPFTINESGVTIAKLQRNIIFLEQINLRLRVIRKILKWYVIRKHLQIVRFRRLKQGQIHF
jgi:hypothetical protein